MSRWIQLVALFLVVFAVVDVCSGEHCDVGFTQLGRDSIQVQAQDHSSAGEQCQLDEDCFACAHYAPGTPYVLTLDTLAFFSHLGLYAPTLDGASAALYHPPRVQA